MPFVWGE
jgi:hypothetical protein